MSNYNVYYQISIVFLNNSANQITISICINNTYRKVITFLYNYAFYINTFMSTIFSTYTQQSKSKKERRNY